MGSACAPSGCEVTAAAFDARPHPRLVVGPGSVERLGEVVADSGGTRVLLVTDAGLVAAGHARRAIAALERSGLWVTVYHGVHENPTARDVERCAAAARAAVIDCLVGFGGGSSIDSARGANFLLTNGGHMRDYWGVGKAPRPFLPLVAVPTTSGTGSECQSFALIADDETHEKMACGDPKAMARAAVLDPTLTVSQPRGVTARTGIDAVAHALEAAVTTRRTLHSGLYAREAFRLTAGSLARVLDVPGDVAARGAMQLGAAYAGLAIENSMLGAAHSAANPLTARLGMIHGEAVGVMLPHVLRFNAAEPGARRIYHDLAAVAELVSPSATDGEAVAALLSAVERLLEMGGLPRRLGSLGVREEQLPVLAREAFARWTTPVNPRRAEAADFEALYRAAL